MSNCIGTVVLGSTGRAGNFLHRAWSGGHVSPPGPVYWQTRAAPRAENSLSWDILTEPPPDLSGARVLINLAGATAGSPQLVEANTALALKSLEAAAARGLAHVFIASSAAVYGAGEQSHAEPEVLAPVSDYGRAKAEMEAAVLRWAEDAGCNGPKATLLRIGNIAGADALLGRFRSGCAMVLDQFDDGTGPVRSYIGPASLAGVLAGLVRRAAQGRPLPQVLNVAAERPVAMSELLEQADIPWSWRPAPPSALPRVVLDTARLAGLGLAPGAITARAMVSEWRALLGNPK